MAGSRTLTLGCQRFPLRLDQVIFSAMDNWTFSWLEKIQTPPPSCRYFIIWAIPISRAACCQLQSLPDRLVLPPGTSTTIESLTSLFAVSQTVLLVLCNPKSGEIRAMAFSPMLPTLGCSAAPFPSSTAQY